MRVLKPNMNKLAPGVVNRTESAIKRYHTYKKVTREQNSEYAENTDRYYAHIKWYNVIRETLEEWRKIFPKDAEIISDVFGIGDRIRGITVTQAGMKHHYSVSSIYKLRQAFVLEVAFRAIQEKLIIL